MKAIYRGKLYTVIDDQGDGVLLDDAGGKGVLLISFSDPELVIDPSDDEVLIARDQEQPSEPEPTS